MVVIGAGIIGISTALALQAKGHEVLVVDRQDGEARASEMNAGAFAFTDVVPLATPGIMRKAPKWLLDPVGPLSVPPAYALKIAPWMLRFWRASWPDRYRHSLAAQADLMKLSQAALENQIGDTDAEHLFRREGQLQLFEGEAEFRASRHSWALRKEHGIRFVLLTGSDAIAEIQPGLHPRFTHAGFTPDWINTCDPAQWLAFLSATFSKRGGRFSQAEVTALKPVEGEVQLQTPEGALVARQVIVCTGAWSHHLARTIGDRIPLETERGYNTTLPDGAFELKTHLTFGGHGFVVTRINNGIRVGGAVELGGLKLPPNYKRADILLTKAKSFLPDLETRGGTRWMGFRPSIPDSLPVIARSPNDSRVIYAFGHGHLGLTQSAGTAELVAALVNDASLPIDMSAFSAHRF
ncbi:MAG: FAD-dependent oxidoreductase [Roseibium sp.]|uniref:NAD(P)/FAD-dependent oxidoreductase n=1 Tax=Roseibium sp. TaxID=1936156 RepID=UPI00263661E3|nr:FAD-dependent oxidoreductase [Roseibium sp.]MCV0429327.1 FAD-dependent oxidoreductase [Roseibium sp.]